MKEEMKPKELLNSVFGNGGAPLPTAPAEPPAPVEPEKPAKKDLSPFTALKAQQVYSNPMDTQTGGAVPPIKGGMSESMNTAGSWGAPK